MVSVAFALVLIAASLGALLVWMNLAPGRAVPRWQLGVLHAVLGATGLAALLIALRGPPHGEAMGVGAFGRIAAWLLALALLMGLVLLSTRLRHRRPTSGPIGIHAMLAISGVVILAAYTLVG
jgi:hypothetical protein